MAKQDMGIIGGFRGTIGPVIGYQWRGRWCMRARPRYVKNPRTEAQQEHRMLFRDMVQMASRLTPVLRYGMRQASIDQGLTEGNLFVRMNKDCFTPQGIDYEYLMVASGPVAPVAFKPARIDAQGVMHVEFERNPLHMRASGDDEVHVAVYCPSQQRLVTVAPVPRNRKRLSIILPDEWLEEELHVYGFVADYKQRASDSEYIPIATDEESAGGAAFLDGGGASGVNAGARDEGEATLGAAGIGTPFLGGARGGAAEARSATDRGAAEAQRTASGGTAEAQGATDRGAAGAQGATGGGSAETRGSGVDFYAPEALEKTDLRY